jgi:hypothetical protein
VVVHTPVIPEFGSLKQDDFEFVASLDYRGVRPYLKNKQKNTYIHTYRIISEGTKSTFLQIYSHQVCKTTIFFPS